MRASVALALAAAVVTQAGCGTSQILTNDAKAHVIADGRVVGRGQGQITRRGTPGSTTIVVKADDGRREQVVVEREFTAVTLLGGLFTYGICLIACWEFPATVFVPLPMPSKPETAGADPWLTPPAGWQPRTPAGAGEPRPES